MGGQHLIQQPREQRFLAWKVVKHAAFAEPGFTGHRIDCYLPSPVTRRDCARGLKYSQGRVLRPGWWLDVFHTVPSGRFRFWHFLGRHTVWVKCVLSGAGQHAVLRMGQHCSFAAQRIDLEGLVPKGFT